MARPARCRTIRQTLTAKTTFVIYVRSKTMVRAVKVTSVFVETNTGVSECVDALYKAQPYYSVNKHVACYSLLMGQLCALSFMHSGTRAGAKTFVAVTTRVILQLEMHGLQVLAHSNLGTHDGAAQATHPLAAVDRCKAVLHCQCLSFHLQTARQRYRQCAYAGKTRQAGCFECDAVVFARTTPGAPIRNKTTPESEHSNLCTTSSCSEVASFLSHSATPFALSISLPLRELALNLPNSLYSLLTPLSEPRLSHKLQVVSLFLSGSVCSVLLLLSNLPFY